MTKFRVLKAFRDIHTGEVYSPNQFITITIKRSKEVVANLGDGFIERVTEEEGG